MSLRSTRTDPRRTSRVVVFGSCPRAGAARDSVSSATSNVPLLQIMVAPLDMASQGLVAPAEREDDADVVLVGGRIGWSAVERVEDVEGDEDVLPDLALRGGVELDALPAEVAETRIVLKAHVDVGARTIV